MVKTKRNYMVSRDLNYYGNNVGDGGVNVLLLSSK